MDAWCGSAPGSTEARVLPIETFAKYMYKGSCDYITGADPQPCRCVPQTCTGGLPHRKLDHMEPVVKNYEGELMLSDDEAYYWCFVSSQCSSAQPASDVCPGSYIATTQLNVPNAWPVQLHAARA
jgi:hypothetical protein